MKKLLAALITLVALCAATAHAAPFLYADVAVGTTACGVVIDGGAKVTSPTITVPVSPSAPTGVQCKHDLAGLSPGSHTITATAIAVADPVWGTQESAASAPLTTVRPTAPAVPQNPKLSAM